MSDEFGPGSVGGQLAHGWREPVAIHRLPASARCTPGPVPTSCLGLARIRAAKVHERAGSHRLEEGVSRIAIVPRLQAETPDVHWTAKCPLCLLRDVVEVVKRSRP